MTGLPDSAAALQASAWDVLVVGTGMGGSTLGWSLARAGRRVLFLERGKNTLPGTPDTIRDGQPELGFKPADLADPAAMDRALRRAGRCVEPILDATSAKTIRFTPFIGNGTGGSSALYGMVCERLFPNDFTPRSQHPAAAEATLPEAWPIRYGELLPWYVQAESLYRVRGTPDPLRPDDREAHLLAPAPLTPANQELFEFLADQGLHPYQLHMACEQHPDCQTCQSYLCPRDCKNDASKICLAPALERHGAALLPECAVTHLEASRSAVSKVHCTWRGERLALAARHVVLAAGALVTPILLLHSRSPDWPHGLGNDHDLVGRNLMRHCIDLHVIWPRWNQRITGQVKEVGLNDFYQTNGQKLGTLQSAGPVPPFALLANQTGWVAKGLRGLAPVLVPLWERYLYRAVALAAIMEDLPYHDNRVLPDRPPSDGALPGVRLEYRFRDGARAKIFRRLVGGALKKYRPFSFHASGDNKPIAHVCGTCRFGDDPRTSVLDRDNRVHGLRNLTIVDSSFFPSSGGLNPSLTVAANALRVAKVLNERLG